MNDDQFNELLANVMLVALSAAGIFQQNQKRGPLSVEEIDRLQTDLLVQTKKLKDSLAERNPLHDWAPILSSLTTGRADSGA